MAHPDDRLAQWLRDAHAMEMQALKMMEGQVERLENYPELRARIRQHIDETRGQADRLEACIGKRGKETSTLKDAAGRMMAMMQSMSGVFAGDEVVKGAMASYTFEHLEIASYRTLIAAAERVGDEETRRVCEENLKEEEAMAAWLADHLPATTQKYLEREMAGVEAKR